MTQAEVNTIALLERALKEPTLALPGGCEYVNEQGQRCIVGTMLHLEGIPDGVMTDGEVAIMTGYCDDTDNPNTITFTRRPDLIQALEKLGLDISTVRSAQSAWDTLVVSSNTPKPVREYLYLLIQKENATWLDTARKRMEGVKSPSKPPRKQPITKDR